MKLSEYKYRNRCPRYAITAINRTKNDFRHILFNVTEKQKEHINRNYLNASIQDRYQLLAGIIDTDGWLNKSGFGYVVTWKSLSLAKDLQELARSLGITAIISKKRNSKYDRYYYDVRLSGKNCSKIPTKVKHCKQARIDRRLYTFSIIPTEVGEYYGLTIGGDHLFLLEDYTIVHNTQVASFIYLYSVLDYAFSHRDACSVHIIYFSLEESPQRVLERYMSHLLYQFDGIRLAPSDLRSTSSEYPVPDEALELLQSQKYKERLDFFKQCVQFETEETNPTGIRNVCINYAKKVGMLKTRKMPSKSDPSKEVEVFESYIPNDPNHYKIVIVDHMSLIESERGMRLKESMDKLSEYFVKYLRNRFGFTCVAIQQQAFDNEGLEAIKQKRLVPTVASLSDTKYTSRDADLVLGLFSPDKFGIPNWLGYDISRLRGYARFLQVIANRNGEVGGICPLFFDGAVCDFEELPPPDKVNELAQYYLEAESRMTYKQQRKLLSLGVVVNVIIKRIFNKK